MGIPNCNLTLCKCQTEKIENEENSLETKDYIIIALAIALFLLVVVLVMVGCYWKRRRNKDNAKTTENIEKRLQVNIYIL
jgi:heme/copper-type cytochrome/quinol oxidase subunit 2